MDLSRGLGDVYKRQPIIPDTEISPAAYVFQHQED
jgi:hypothetical protein